eukprot:gene10719-biopygen22836
MGIHGFPGISEDPCQKILGFPRETTVPQGNPGFPVKSPRFPVVCCENDPLCNVHCLQWCFFLQKNAQKCTKLHEKARPCSFPEPENAPFAQLVASLEGLVTPESNYVPKSTQTRGNDRRMTVFSWPKNRSGWLWRGPASFATLDVAGFCYWHAGSLRICHCCVCRSPGEPSPPIYLC